MFFIESVRDNLHIAPGQGKSGLQDLGFSVWIRWLSRSRRVRETGSEKESSQVVSPKELEIHGLLREGSKVLRLSSRIKEAAVGYTVFCRGPYHVARGLCPAAGFSDGQGFSDWSFSDPGLLH